MSNRNEVGVRRLRIFFKRGTGNRENGETGVVGMVASTSRGGGG
jgi:hypothetical protein